MRGLFVKIKKLFSLPPRDLWIRLGAQLGPRLDYASLGQRESTLDKKKLLKKLSASNLNSLHCRVMEQAMPWNSQKISTETFDVITPDEVARVLDSAEAAIEGWVCLMGSGPVQIGTPGIINWYKDLKSGLEWPLDYFHKLNPSDLDRPSDVKFPWELSRMQWLIPVAQAWQLTNEDRYAAHLRIVIEDWLVKNPCAWGINWSCTMEPAMRVFTLCWFYQMTANAPSWQDQTFRFQFLQTIYLHLKFIRRYLEITDVNGNHLTADAAALVVGGVFLGEGVAESWKKEGWRLLQREINSQVYTDGVDFEGSVPYHRLVAELFHIAAVAMDVNNDKVPVSYQKYLLKMADYTEAYMRPDGVAPVIGDNDDARTLPLGGQAIGDHRYLPSLIRYHWAPHLISEAWLDNASECVWWFGKKPETFSERKYSGSRRFQEGGSYILRSDSDYVFFDCGPLGLANRGGHGHNDMLSFEAIIDGCPLVSDPGCPVYTGDWKARNLSRSTVSHNTVQINEEEINRFISEKNLWFLHGDSQCEELFWEDSPQFTIISGCHSGYMRLEPSVSIERRLILDKKNHSLAWMDHVTGCNENNVTITLQLAAYVIVEKISDQALLLKSHGKSFILNWNAQKDWQLVIEKSQVSPQYGILLSALRLKWLCKKSKGDVAFFATIHQGEQSSLKTGRQLYDILESITH